MDTQKIAGIAWPSLLVLLTAIYGYWAAQRELASSRPVPPSQYDVPDPVPSPGVHSVHSRIWQDPLSTAYQDWENSTLGSRPDALRTVSDSDLERKFPCSEEKGPDAKKEASAPKGQASDREEERQDREKKSREPLLSGMVESIRAIVGPPDRSAERLGRMKDLFRDLVDESSRDTLCLPVFVPGGPYAEDKETRMRIRYAVTTALAESDYHLKYSRRMSYVTVRVWIRTLRGWQEREVAVPVKLYRPIRNFDQHSNDEEDTGNERDAEQCQQGTDAGERESDEDEGAESEGEDAGNGAGADQCGKEDDKNKRQVLLLWINEEELGLRPLLATQRILHGIFSEVECKDRLDISIIGPSSSDMLDLISQEHKKTVPNRKSWDQTFKTLKDGEICGPKSHWFITDYERFLQCEEIEKSPWLLTLNSNDESCSSSIPILSPRATKMYSPDDSNTGVPGQVLGVGEPFELYRVIGTDQQLARSIVAELKQRGAFPGRVALITEHDTTYGRRITETFRSVLNEYKDKSDAWALCSCKILRGIDGSLPGEKEPAGLQSDRPVQGNSASQDITDIVERPPQGRSQFDYLRRLPEHIEQHASKAHGATVQTGLDEDRELPLTAIGVVGSDVYDKLLVLQALKPHFPDCVFFTTDLDAIYWHADQLSHARNLLIASHFGLTLGHHWEAERIEIPTQRTTPPFRDSYQTATFLATRLAVNRGNDPCQRTQLTDLRGVSGHAKQPSEYTLSLEPVSKEADIPKEGCDEVIVAKVDDHLHFRIFDHQGKRVVDLPAKCVCAGHRETLEGLKDQLDRLWENREDLASNQKKEIVETVVSLVEYPRSWEGWLSPVMHVIGRDGPYPLPVEAPAEVDWVEQQNAKTDSSGWHLLFVVGLSVVLAGGGLLVNQRDCLHDSPLFCNKDEDTSASPERLAVGGKWTIGVVLLIGVLLVLALLLWPGDRKASPFAVTDTWLQNVFYVCAGIGAGLCLGWLVDRFVVRMREVPKNKEDVDQKKDVRKEEDIYQRAWEAFQIRHAVQAIVFAVVVVDVGVLFVYGMWFSAVASGLIGGVLFLVSLCIGNPPSGERRSEVLPCDARNTGLGGFWAILVLTLLAVIVHLVSDGTPTGWSPGSISRGFARRAIDCLALSYAFGMVGILFSVLLYTQFWCRELSKSLKKIPAENLRDTARTGNDVARLQIAEQITEAPGILAPALMALLLVLVLSSHPFVAPSPMPYGVLVVITITMVVFICATLWHRYYFHQEQREALSGIEQQLVRLQREEESKKSRRPISPLEQALVNLSRQHAESSPQRAFGSNQAKKRDKSVSKMPVGEDEDDRGESKSLNQLSLHKQQLSQLSGGVFGSWSQTPLGWLFGGGTTLALVDWWIRWWITSL